MLSTLGKVVGLFGLCFFLIGFVHSSALMYMVAIFCLGALLGAAGAAWQSIRGLACIRDAPTATVYSGDPVGGTITVREHRSRWRLLELFDVQRSLLTGAVTHRGMTVLTGGPRAQVAMVAGSRHTQRLQPAGARELAVHDTMRFARRGYYRLGPLTVRGHDPFGLIALERVFPVYHEIIVYPHPLPMPTFMLSGSCSLRQHTEVRASERVGQSADFHGIRPYVQGDDLRRVHWKATAHTGKLAIKEFEYQFGGSVQVVLDLQQETHWGEGEYASLEAAVTLSASLIHHVLTSGHEAGFLATSARLIHLAPESGERQLHRVMESLALAQADGGVTLGQTLAGTLLSVSRRCTTIIITASTDRAMIGPLLAVRGRAAHVLLVLLNARSFQDATRENRPKLSLASLAATPMKLQPIWAQAMGTPPLPAEAHEDIVHAARAAGLDVYPVEATTPLHQVLQGIRARM
jgi:uncharacterized protein (DUF58 family)